MTSVKQKGFSIYLFTLFIMLFSLESFVFPQDVSSSDAKKNLYFYSGVIKSDDVSKGQVATDLFYSQFQIENVFNVVDKRTSVFTTEILESHSNTNDVLFYNTITEDDDKWYSSLYLIDFSASREVSVKYVYDEYYRVLIDAKDILSELLAKYNSSSYDTIDTSEVPESANPNGTITIASLFGTWKGETHIDKIVILRGGKGFVIFENGASMNISVAIEENTLIAKQESKSNASFYPELPREVALVKALDFNPIEWELTIESEDSMVGVKHAYSAESVSSDNVVVEKTEIPVKWYR